jgi:hypothetical protein
LRFPSQSLCGPENTFAIIVVASAAPSKRPSATTLKPIVVTRKMGSKAWISSEERSMKRLTSPSAHTVRGMEGRRRERRVVLIGAEAYILVTMSSIFSKFR